MSPEAGLVVFLTCLEVVNEWVWSSYLWLAVKLYFFLCFRSVINANRIPLKKKTSRELKGMKSPGLFYFPIAVPFRGLFTHYRLRAGVALGGPGRLGMCFLKVPEAVDGFGGSGGFRCVVLFRT